MKITHKLNKPISETESVHCNKCGLSIKSPMGSYYGLVEAVATGGYESVAFNDGDVFKFSMCEHCLKELFATFMYDPLQGNFIDETVPQNPDFDPEEYWNNDIKVAPVEDTEEEEEESLIQNMDRTSYDPFDYGIVEDGEVVELVHPILPKKREDLN